MDVSIIIVNYNTSNLIASCIESIIEYTSGIKYEVIVVDNNSEPDFIEIINRSIPLEKKDAFHFLSLPENIGFGRANNEGLKIAKGRNILFLNPDTLLLDNSIKILSDFLDSHPEAGACGGNLVDENFKPAFSFKRFLPGCFWELNELLNTIPQKIFYGASQTFNYKNKPLKVGFISGADLMVKKNVLDTTGAFRDDYFMYFEETDLCHRIRKHGWKIYNIPVRIQHLESRSLPESDSYQSEFKTKHLELSRQIYYQLNVKGLEGKLSQLLYYLFLHSRLLLLKNKNKREYYAQRLKYLKG